MSSPYEFVGLALKEGIAVMDAQSSEPKPVPRYSIVTSTVDPARNYCVSVILPFWASTLFLWWKLPRKTFKRLNALRTTSRKETT